jgi:hypothetical protein
MRRGRSTGILQVPGVCSGPGPSWPCGGESGGGGSVGLPLDAWLGDDRDGGGASGRSGGAEGCRDRGVPERCPVMVQCDVYANTVTPDGKVVGAGRGFVGGRTSLERHRRADCRPAGAAGRIGGGGPEAGPGSDADDRPEAGGTGGVGGVLGAGGGDGAGGTLGCSEGELAAVPAGAACWACRRTRRGCGCWRWLGSGGFCRTFSVVADDGSVPAIPPETKDVLREVAGSAVVVAVETVGGCRRPGSHGFGCAVCVGVWGVVCGPGRCGGRSRTWTARRSCRCWWWCRLAGSMRCVRWRPGRWGLSRERGGHRVRRTSA